MGISDGGTLTGTGVARSSNNANGGASTNKALATGGAETRPKNVAVTFCVYSGYQSAPGQTVLTTLASLTDVSVGGVTTGQVLSFDGASWVPSNTAAGADNLGNHTATQNLTMGAHNVVGTGQVSVTDISVTHLQLKSPATLACNAGALGTIRFNPTTGAPQICVQR